MKNIITLILSGLFLSSNAVYAVSCATDGGTITSSVTVFASCDYNSSVTVGLSPSQPGTLSVNDSSVTVTNNSGSTVTISNTSPTSQLFNFGVLNNALGGNLVNSQNGYVENDYNLSNSGNFTNSGTFLNYGDFVQSTTGYINQSGSQLTNNGYLENGWYMTNNGTINNTSHYTAATMLSPQILGGIDNYGFIDNNAAINNLQTASMYIYESINNHTTGVIDNAGSIITGGTCHNTGYCLQGEGIINNDGTLTNEATGVINLVGVQSKLVNNGTINNFGTINGYLSNDLNRGLLNNGVLNNAGLIDSSVTAIASSVTNAGTYAGNGTFSLTGSGNYFYNTGLVRPSGTTFDDTSVGLMTINSNYFDDGTMRFVLASLGSYDQLMVLGNFGLGNSILEVLFGNGFDLNTLTDGTLFNIISYGALFSDSNPFASRTDASKF